MAIQGVNGTKLVIKPSTESKTLLFPILSQILVSQVWDSIINSYKCSYQILREKLFKFVFLCKSWGYLLLPFIWRKLEFKNIEYIERFVDKTLINLSNENYHYKDWIKSISFRVQR